MTHLKSNNSNIFNNNSYLKKITTWIRTTHIEIYVLWFTLLSTIIIFLMITISDIDDRYETIKSI